MGLGLLIAPMTVVWVLGMQVSINLLDGADGVAAGVIAIVATVCLLAAINRIEGPADIQSGVVDPSGAVMGCCVGFLIFNLPPARMFMGDSGTHFLGVALAVITILGVAKIAVGLSILMPLIALGLPIGDTAFAIVRRRRRGGTRGPTRGTSITACARWHDPARDRPHLLPHHRDPGVHRPDHLRSPAHHRRRARAAGGGAGRAGVAQSTQSPAPPFRRG